MKKRLIIMFYAVILVLASSLYASGQRFGWDDLEQFLKKPHIWTGTQTFDDVVISGGTVYATLNTPSSNFSTSGATLTQTNANLPITQILQGTAAGVIGSAVYDSTGASVFAVMQDKTASFGGSIDIPSGATVFVDKTQGYGFWLGSDNKIHMKDVTDGTALASYFMAAAFSADKTKRYIEAHSTDHTQVTVKGSNIIPFKIGTAFHLLQSDVNLSLAMDLDSGTTTAGKDYYVYAVSGVTSGNVLDFIISENSTWPSTYTADTSIKIGGFHLLCASVGTIGGHTLTGYLIGDILPASIWDLKHRPRSSPEGMVWSEQAGIWVDIYLASGTGASTSSANGGTISDTRTWLDFVDDFHAVKKQLLSDSEFQAIAAGSNEETNISGSADPVTTGGHSDTAGRRMISEIGVEDACGAMWQWLVDTSYQFDAPIGHTHAVTVSGAAETVATSLSGTTDIPTWGYYDLPGAKGSFFRQGSYGDVKLRAGGHWNPGTDCGSRSRDAYSYRWYTHTTFGGRGRSEPQ